MAQTSLKTEIHGEGRTLTLALVFSGAILTSAGSRVAMPILASQAREPTACSFLAFNDAQCNPQPPSGYLISSEKCDRVHSRSLPRPVRLTLGRGRQSCHANI